MELMAGSRRYEPDMSGADGVPAWVNFVNLYCFAETLRRICSDDNKVFVWPCQSLGFLRALCLTLEQAPPGTFFSVKNGAKPPQEFLKSYPQAASGSHQAEARGQGASASGSHQAEAGEGVKGWRCHDWVQDYYHGTSLHGLFGILTEGFCPNQGAGSWALQEYYGFEVPGVYVATHFGLACSYPMHTYDGTLPSNGSLAPVRVVLRCIANPDDRLWWKNDKQNQQCLFLPSSLHVSHIIFFMVNRDAVPRSLSCMFTRRLFEPRTPVSISAAWELLCNPRLVPYLSPAVFNELTKILPPVPPLAQVTRGSHQAEAGTPVIWVCSRVRGDEHFRQQAARDDAKYLPWCYKYLAEGTPIPVLVRVGHMQVDLALWDSMFPWWATNDARREATPEGYMTVEVDYTLAMEASRRVAERGGSHQAEAKPAVGWGHCMMAESVSTDDAHGLHTLHDASGKLMDSTLQTPAFPATPELLKVGASGSHQAEAAPKAKSAASLKRARKRAATTPAPGAGSRQLSPYELRNHAREYSKYFKIAAATLHKMPIELESMSYRGMWVPPTSEQLFANEWPGRLVNDPQLREHLDKAAATARENLDFRVNDLRERHVGRARGSHQAEAGSANRRQAYSPGRGGRARSREPRRNTADQAEKDPWDTFFERKAARDQAARDRGSHQAEASRPAGASTVQLRAHSPAVRLHSPVREPRTRQQPDHRPHPAEAPLGLGAQEGKPSG